MTELTLYLSDGIVIISYVCVCVFFFFTNCDFRYSRFFRMLEKRSLSYNDGPIPVPLDDAFLADNVQRICVCGCDTGM